MHTKDVAARRGIAQLALKAFFSLAERWQLTRPEAMTLLGLTATSTYANWKNGKTTTLPRDTLERISYLLKIDESLRLSQISNTATNQWLRTPQQALTGLEPLQKMLQGNVIDLYSVMETMEQMTAIPPQSISAN